MTTLLTGVNGGTFPNTAVGPAAGEVITASSVNTPVQACLNECKYLYDTKANLAGQRVQTSLLRNADAGTITHASSAVAPTELGYQVLDNLGHGQELVSVTLWFDRNNTGVLPTTRVKGTLYKTLITATSSDTEIVSETEDPTSTLAPYEAHHGLVLTPGSTEIIDSENYVYWVRIRGESGSDTAAITWYCSTAICAAP